MRELVGATAVQGRLSSLPSLSYHPPPMIRFCLCALVLLLSAALCAQEGAGHGDAKTGQTDGKVQAEGKSKASKTGVPGKEDTEDDSKLTAEQRLEKHMVHGGRGHCHFVSACLPGRVLPGGSGTMVVTMVLDGDAVLVSPPPMTFNSPTDQGMVSVGSPTFRPAKVATLAKAFQGQPAYDNYAILDVPFTVSQQAALGSKHAVSLQMVFDLHSGTSGSMLARFSDSTSATFEVNPDTTVAVGAAARVEPHMAAPADKPPPRHGGKQNQVDVDEPKATTGGIQTGGSATGQGQEDTQVVSAPVGNEALSGSDSPAVEPENRLPWMAFAAAGAILAILVLMLLLRRK